MKSKIPLSINLRELIFAFIGKFLKLKTCSVIFCFHSISDDESVFSITADKFEIIIKTLLIRNKIASLKSVLNSKNNIDSKKVAITFDDGYEDVFKNAYPILKRNGIKACVFMNGIPDNKGNFGYLAGKKLLSLNQIRILKKNGWEVGYHTKTHPDLRRLDKKMLTEEVVKSKKKLEKALGYKLDYFAYPHGVFNKKVLQVVEKAGYKYGFTVSGSGCCQQKEPFKIDRVLIDGNMGVDDIEVITSCQGLYFNKLLTKFVRIKDDLLKNKLL